MEQADYSNFFHTKAQASDFSARLSNVSDKIFETGFDLEKVLSKELGIEKKEKFISFLREANVNMDKAKDIKDFLDLLVQNISKLPTLYINIAFEPTDETMKLLSEWFILNIKRQFVFDITLNRELIGGALIDFNGKASDYSIKSKFDKIVKEVTQSTSPLTKKNENQNLASNSV